MRSVARGINWLTRGKLHPNVVTFASLLMHIPIAYLIAQGDFVWAGGLLVIFGLFDTLDGELARLQNRVSTLGMLLDSVSDRMKEAMLYMGIGYYLVTTALQSDKEVGYFAVVTVAACGGSLLVSYVNAWGEAVMTQAQKAQHQVNQAFRTGLMKYEIRMFLLVVGLLFDWLLSVVVIIALLSWVTAFERLFNVSRRLK
jgi:phosphatidylglycerophosphate synthase